MEELIDVLKALSNDMHKGDTALFELCEKMITQICAQDGQIRALLENQKLMAQLMDKMGEKIITLEAYTNKRTH